jgi:hypothetical protein
VNRKTVMTANSLSAPPIKASSNAGSRPTTPGNQAAPPARRTENSNPNSKLHLIQFSLEWEQSGLSVEWSSHYYLVQVTELHWSKKSMDQHAVELINRGVLQWAGQQRTPVWLHLQLPNKSQYWLTRWFKKKPFSVDSYSLPIFVWSALPEDSL